MKIAILGSGLSGLMAAKGLDDNGFENFDILTKEIKKPNPKGYMILHDLCGMMLENKIFPVYQNGEEKYYKEKLNYGDISASWKSGLSEYWMVGYNPYQAIDLLWKKFRNKCYHTTVSTNIVENLKKDYDYIISTIPPNNLYSNVSLTYASVWIKELEDPINYSPHVIYNGYDFSNITRSSIQLWNNKSFVEYCKPVEDAQKVKKPLYFNGEIKKDDKIILTGRKGLWNKNILAHQVYYKIYGKTKNNSIPIL